MVGFVCLIEQSVQGMLLFYGRSCPGSWLLKEMVCTFFYGKYVQRIWFLTFWKQIWVLIKIWMKVEVLKLLKTSSLRILFIVVWMRTECHASYDLDQTLDFSRSCSILMGKSFLNTSIKCVGKCFPCILYS